MLNLTLTPTMSEKRLPGYREGTAFVLLVLALHVLGLAALYVPTARPAAVPLAYGTPVALLTGLYLATRIVRLGSQPAPAGLLIAGCVFVVGGAAFDIFATIFHSPNLEQESNPVARLLLDSGHSTSFVYVFGGFCQIALAALGCTLWAGLLRHRKDIVHSVRQSTSVMQLVKALTGGAGLSWRQWLCPLKVSELPDFSFYVWIFAVMYVAGAAYRWYLGLEWFGFSLIDSTYVAVAAMLMGVAGYLAWVQREVARATNQCQIGGETL